MNIDAQKYIVLVIFRYNKENKLLDTTGIDEIIKALITTYNLEEYIKHISYQELDNYKAQMAYSYFNKTIYVSPDFMKGLKRTSERMLDSFKIKDRTLATNLDIIHAIFHEVNHARQYKYIDETNNNLNKKLLELSLNANMIKNVNEENKDKIYEFAKLSQNDEKIYSYLPSEFNAEYNALKQIREILNRVISNETYKYMDFYDMNINLFIYTTYQKKLFRIVSPSENFIKIRNKKVSKEEINLKENIKNKTLEERLDFGLPITKKEYDEIDEKIRNKVQEMVEFDRRYNNL